MFSALQLALSLGFLIALPLVLFTVGGVWLDMRMGTMPIFTIIGALGGMIMAGILMFRNILPYVEKRSGKSK